MRFVATKFACLLVALAYCASAQAFDNSAALLRGNAFVGARVNHKPGNIAGQIDKPFGDPLTAPLGLAPLERTLFADLAQGRLEHYSLLEAALVASGVKDLSALDQYDRKFSAVRDEVRQQLANLSGGTPDEIERQIKQIHFLLHQRLLAGGYDANATNLGETLDTGVYNCASATLLFVALASDLGLQAGAVELPGHVRAVVTCGREQFEIEVTCPQWPQAMRRTAVQTASVDNTGASAGLQTDGQRPVSWFGLIAMIYYNRGVDAFQNRQFAAAIAANRRALLLDSANQTARGNLLAAVNNWALALCDAGDYAEAEALLTAGRKFDPAHQPFIHNAAHVEHQWAQAQAA
ncbi:MAG TPA: hypothetical protein VGJ15_12135, partial [Pirellulales bacterium]